MHDVVQPVGHSVSQPVFASQFGEFGELVEVLGSRLIRVVRLAVHPNHGCSSRIRCWTLAIRTRPQPTVKARRTAPHIQSSRPQPDGQVPSASPTTNGNDCQVDSDKQLDLQNRVD
jgi:hypothetical protein